MTHVCFKTSAYLHTIYELLGFRSDAVEFSVLAGRDSGRQGDLVEITTLSLDVGKQSPRDAVSHSKIAENHTPFEDVN
jgi:hypothetical protein